jgi:hypothetical protein
MLRYLVEHPDRLMRKAELRRHVWAGARHRCRAGPEGLRQFLLRRIEDLPPEARRVIEAASLVGKECTVAAVAVGVQHPMEDVEVLCEELI